MSPPGMSTGKLLLSSPPPDRIFYHGHWAGGDGNQRYSQLLPRLSRIDSFLTRVSQRRFVRGVQTRLLAATMRQRYRFIFAAANRRYRLMFATDYRQIPYFEGQVVVDVDDPTFSREEVELLNRPNVSAYVVTTERARSRFEQLGVTTPGHVISQGVDLGAFDEQEAARIASRHRRPGEVTMGYVARWLLSDPDRKGDHPLDGIRHLLALWERIRARVPDARLWLIGAPDKATRRLCADRSDLLLLGRIPQEQVPSYVANFDIALYPRRIDHAPMPIKLTEYIAMGVPTVSYDLELAQVLRETGAGCLAGTEEEFVERVARLAGDEAERARLSAAAKQLSPSLDWNSLARSYQTELLDRYLC
jgi:glycosyltransferase involved in cell wall biosynthesis